MSLICMTMLNHIQASGQGRQSPHLGRQLYCITRCSTLRLSYLWLHERGFKRQTLWQWRRSENCSNKVAQRTVNKFMRQWYMLSFEDGTLLLRKTVTMLRSRDVIHRGPALFWCTIHVPVQVIIPVLKKKALFFLFTLVFACMCKDGFK